MDSRYLQILLFILLSGYSTISGSDEIPNHAVILQYHHVSAEMPAITSISPTGFLEHLTYLEQQGFLVTPLDQVISALSAKKPLPDKTVVITFDDAYLNIYQTAWPMIAAKGWSFSLFVSTELVGSNPALYMDWDQVRELHDAGVLIGNHTMHHTHLLRKQAGETDEQWLARVRGEITGAQDTLESKLGQVKKIFAYPYGEYSDQVKQQVKALDYIGLGQQSGAIGESTDWQEVPRFPASGIYSDLTTLQEKLLTLPLPVTSPSPDSLLSLEETRPILSVDLGDGQFRIEQLACFATAQGPIEIIAQQANQFRTRARVDLPVGRSRYNCTVPTLDGSRYFWFSQPWIRRNVDGSWYPED
jgi:biofilm PGA synthesis lipoprotein PgaB